MALFIMTKSLGVNAQSFINHIEAGIEAAGLKFSDFQPFMCQHEDGRVGIAFSQLRPGRSKKSRNAAIDSTIVCFENGIEWLNCEATNKLMPINEQQPPSMLAVLFLGAMLTKSPVFLPACECCEAAK